MDTVIVKQLIVGFCEEVPSPWKDHPEWNCCHATGTVSYVCTQAEEGVDVVFDLGSPWNREEVVQLLKEQFRKNVANGWVRKRLFLVVSHVHIDHVGNLDLVDEFRKVKCFAEVEIVCGQTLEAELSLCDGRIRVLKTPGHTDHDISLVVESSNYGKVAIAGDCFESHADIADPSIWKAVSLYPEEQEKSRLRILDTEKVDFIIPGHGPGFVVASEVDNTTHSSEVCIPANIDLFLDETTNPVRKMIAQSDGSADEISIIDIQDIRILVNCGPAVKRIMSEEDRKKVDIVVVTGGFLNTYCLGLFSQAQIILGHDLAAPNSIYTGDHVKDDTIKLGSGIRLDFEGSNLKIGILENVREESIASHARIL
ncbi:hypothetical protein QR680_017746 [Steinernema hermaphroditum]|uniref:Metallo-beta-lactamase domain-containing protein 1 n=1 Tax=Steinernema hermaphroditum TaxID=289476 RepID=A0AA39HFN7_9BILA|nr:hypothetical protein QR680_017746 [Steinernema hermaphroditum]